MQKRFLCLLLAVLLMAGMLPVSAFAAETKTYLALGDSISTGYGLADPASQSFTAQVAQMLGENYAYSNMAENGLTAQGLYDKLRDAGLQSAVQQADVITLTIGGNDLMALLYEYLAENMDLEPKLTVDEVAAALASYNEEVLNAATALISRGEFKPSASVIGNISQIYTEAIGRIKTLNPDAVLIVTTQYNPYAGLAALVEQYGAIFEGTTYESAANAILLLSEEIEAALAVFNAAIKKRASGNYLVADIYTIFDSSSAALCNAGLVLGASISINLDIHPNAAGHTLIAETIKPLLPGFSHTHSFENGICTGCGKLEYFPGDVNGDETVDNYDLLRMLYHVNQREPLENEGLLAADVTGNRTVDIWDVQHLILYLNKRIDSLQ